MNRQRGKKKAGVACLFEKPWRGQRMQQGLWGEKSKKIKLNKQSLRRTGLKIKVRKKSRGK